MESKNRIECLYLSQEDLLRAGCLDMRMAMQAAENAMLAFREDEVLFPEKIVQIFNEETQDETDGLRRIRIDFSSNVPSQVLETLQAARVQSLLVEGGELLEQFQWLTPEQSANPGQDRVQRISDEMADVLIYLVRLADALDVDLQEAVQSKLAHNREKYPAELVRGDARKYDEYD